MPEIKTIGSRAEVFHGNAKHTSGGLKRSDLKLNKHGKIVSINASKSAKKQKNLGECLVPKGTHKFILGGRCNSKTRSKSSKRKTSKRKTSKRKTSSRRPLNLTQAIKNRVAGKPGPSLTKRLQKILMR